VGSLVDHRYGVGNPRYMAPVWCRCHWAGEGEGLRRSGDTIGSRQRNEGNLHLLHDRAQPQDVVLLEHTAESRPGPVLLRSRDG